MTDAESEFLFDVEPFIVQDLIPKTLSAERKRTLRRKQMIESGIHPATRSRCWHLIHVANVAIVC